MKKKILFIILDGGGDIPSEELNGLTPAEVARTPTLDILVSKGINGLMDVLGPGIVPGSDTAHLALLGYDPFKKSVYNGRGPVEAAGVGLKVKPGDIAFRANFASFNIEDKIIEDRRAGRISDRTDELARLINGREIEGVEILFKEGTEHRGALILRGEDLSASVTANDPKIEGIPPKPFKAVTPRGNKTAKILKELMEQLKQELPQLELNKVRRELSKHEANYLLIRGAGEAMDLPLFGMDQGIRAACVAGGGLYKGVATLAGMEVLEVPGATGGINSNFDAKVNKAVNCLEGDKYNFIFLHFKATDNAGHDGKFKLKKEIFEKIDTSLKPVLELDDVVIGFTPDHSTPCSIKDHSCDPVPCFVAAPNRRKDTVENFGEKFAMKGSINGIRGKEFMNLIFGLANRNKKFGS
ncbi:MAG: 2,3-bisphosphoglycerate-independent phosphoglycerate mutase [Candidatus Hodarchaeales archaeon]